MPGGNCSKVMKPHTQRHGQKKRDHHVQETANRLVGIDYRIQWFGENKWEDGRYMPGVKARVKGWVQTVKQLMCPTMKPLETYRSGNRDRVTLMKTT